jgi:predicted nucleic acid-binding protein
MIIVSDTTPLRYLIEIEQAHILEKLYGKITIPQKVFSELQGENTPPKVKEWIQAHPEWIEVKQADTSIFTPQRHIQDGEHEAIALAIELKADAFLSDDGDAIQEARRLNIPTVRLFNILESAAEITLIDLPEAVEKIRNTTFRMPPAEIVEAMLERDQQRKHTQEKNEKKTEASQEQTEEQKPERNRKR